MKTFSFFAGLASGPLVTLVWLFDRSVDER
jgi:hypothetical protein